MLYLAGMDYAEKCKIEMEAFDRLPPKLREQLRGSTQNHSVTNILSLMADKADPAAVARMIAR